MKTTENLLFFGANGLIPKIASAGQWGGVLCPPLSAPTHTIRAGTCTLRWVSLGPIPKVARGHLLLFFSFTFLTLWALMEGACGTQGMPAPVSARALGGGGGVPAPRLREGPALRF